MCTMTPGPACASSSRFSCWTAASIRRTAAAVTSTGVPCGIVRKAPTLFPSTSGKNE